MNVNNSPVNSAPENVRRTPKEVYAAPDWTFFSLVQLMQLMMLIKLINDVVLSVFRDTRWLARLISIMLQSIFTGMGKP